MKNIKIKYNGHPQWFYDYVSEIINEFEGEK